MSDAAGNASSDLIARLRQEIAAESEEEVVGIDDVDAAARLPIGVHVSASVMAAVDQLMESDTTPLAVASRQSLLDAVTRSLVANQIWSGPLEPILYELRVATGVDRDELAGQTGIPSDELNKLERGQVRISSRTAAEIVAWIKGVNAPPRASASALARSLGVPPVAPVFAGVGDQADKGKDEELLREVRELLGVAEDPASSE
jgi:transcriptional regulator with XRE-family HTH domain